MVASTQSAETTFSTSAHTCFLTVEVLEDRLDHEVRVGELGLVDRAGDQAAQLRRLARVEPALRGELVDLGVHVGHALVHPGLVEVGQDDRYLEPAGEQQRESGWPSDRRRRCPTLVTSRASAGPGAPTGRLARRWTRSNAYSHCASSSLRSGRPVPRPRPRYRWRTGRPWPGPADRAPGTGPGTAPCSRSSSCCPGEVEHAAPTAPRSTSGRSTVVCPLTTEAAHSSDRSRKSAGSNSTSAMPSSCASAGRSILFCCNGFCTMTCGRVDHADQVRQQLGAAPAGDQAERDLGQRDRRRAGRQGPVPAVQGQLQSAAHGRTVDERERRYAACRGAREHAVPEPADREGLRPGYGSTVSRSRRRRRRRCNGLPVTATNDGSAASASVDGVRPETGQAGRSEASSASCGRTRCPM